jgi:hypothetical protein
MTIEELMTETKVEQLRKLAGAWSSFEDEARSMQPPAGVRHAVAESLVRRGVWIDRRAGDRVAMLAR